MGSVALSVSRRTALFALCALLWGTSITVRSIVQRRTLLCGARADPFVERTGNRASLPAEWDKAGRSWGCACMMRANVPDVSLGQW